MKVEFIVWYDFWFYWSYFYVKAKVATLHINESENFAHGYLILGKLKTVLCRKSSNKAFYVCGKSNVLYMRVIYSIYPCNNNQRIFYSNTTNISLLSKTV